MLAKRLILTLALTGSLAVAGCGSDDESTSSSSSDAPAASTSTPAATPAASGDAVRVVMKNIAFEPKEVTVKVGQKITWTNEEPVDHNVVSNSGAEFKSEIFGEGGTFEFTPKEAGTIEYECTLHPGMVGTITVQ